MLDLQVKKDKNEIWCLTESFQVYKYVDTGTITTMVVVTPEGKIASPYVYRGEEFIPLSVIQEEMGIDKYLKAKKPFYSKISDGFITNVKVGLNFETGELIPKSTFYEVYAVKNISPLSDVLMTISLKRIQELSDDVNSLIISIATEIAKSKGNREQYLLSRL